MNPTVILIMKNYVDHSIALRVDSSTDEHILWDFDNDINDFDSSDSDFALMTDTDQQHTEGPFIDSACSVHM